MSSKLLVLNAGSSSLKFKLFQVEESSCTPIAWGLCERLGDLARSRLKAEATDLGGNTTSTTAPEPMEDHAAALDQAKKFLQARYSPSLISDVGIVGHRVVHGLHTSDPVVIDEKVRRTIEAAAELAPLHNPTNLLGIDAAIQIFPLAAQVAVFDTAFHTTLPPEAYTYALPSDICQRLSLRKYGFHGTSYKYLTERTAKLLGKDTNELNAVLCHLGAGASMCCVRNGESVDTTMGLTPLEGLVMGTRCGDTDPGIITFMQRSGMSLEEIETVLNRRSGFLGLTGSADARTVEEGAANGDEACSLALDVFVHRILRYIGAYWVNLNGRVDALVFSAGIGEHSPEVRRRVCRRLGWLKVELDDVKNEEARGGCAQEVQTSTSSVKVIVLPTDEELSIAEQALVAVRNAENGHVPRQ